MEQRLDKYQLFSVWLFTCKGDPLLPSGGHLIEIHHLGPHSQNASLHLYSLFKKHSTITSVKNIAKKKTCVIEFFNCLHYSHCNR